MPLDRSRIQMTPAEMAGMLGALGPYVAADAVASGLVSSSPAPESGQPAEQDSGVAAVAKGQPDAESVDPAEAARQARVLHVADAIRTAMGTNVPGGDGVSPLQGWGKPKRP